MFIRAITLVLATIGATACAAAQVQEPQIHQIQFPGRGGACPDGYDFNFSNGRCYPNTMHAPGVYNRGDPPYGYDRPHRYGACPHGYDFNYSDGRCYPNRAHVPGTYAR